jgi:hypothetical protein
MAYKWILCFAVSIFLSSCHSAADDQPVNNDSIVKTLNAADSIPRTQQKAIDSVNKAYLDSLKKHMADTSSAEFPAQK